MPFDSKKFLAKAPETSGVYQMLNAEECVIYVGKAKNLKARLRSYFQGTPSNKTRLLVQNIESIQLTITHTEAEALLLEHTLIKQHMPRYNILLRDDKSFPYLYLSEHPQFPSLSSYRGIKRSKGQYFGPYVSTRAMLDALHILQKLFKLRSCHDTMFNNRSRPCLQYQIKRCKAPCVNLVSPEEYQQDVTNTTLFLQGKSQTVITNLVKSMDQAAEALDYEKAAQVRDLIASLQQVQQQQYVINKAGDVDVIAAIIDGDQRACVAKLVFRAGQLLGNKWYFPKTQPETTVSELLTAFVTQHYIGSEEIPKEIIISEQIDSNEILAEILSKKSGRTVKISVATRGTRKQWLQLAKANAEQGLQTHAAKQTTAQQQVQQLQQLLNIDHPIERIECFDISHTQGQATTASCVVFGNHGAINSEYRSFNIAGITPGDDYAAMKQALLRRYSRLQEESAKLPDVLVIDGGKGQLTQAQAVLDELQIDSITLLGIAKGPSRKAGLEKLILADKQELNAADFPAALILLQHIRDEAHRFAITGHRTRRQKTILRSPLENIEGVGPKKRRDLLQHFGGLQQLKQATADDLARTPGINQKLAQRIFDALHKQ